MEVLAAAAQEEAAGPAGSEGEGGETSPMARTGSREHSPPPRGPAAARVTAPAAALGGQQAAAAGGSGLHRAAAGDANAAAAAEAVEAGAPARPRGAKRKRGAPPEPCPFCGHLYTVRDGLSSRQDAAGNRLHLRRCQCRKKTPPCK